MSIIAVVLDGYGGAPVVVTELEELHHHVRPGMIPLVVPDLRVQEPIAWEDIPRLLATADAYVDWWIRTRNDPEILEHPAVKMYQIRRRQSDHRRSTDLSAIAET